MGGGPYRSDAATPVFQVHGQTTVLGAVHQARHSEWGCWYAWLVFTSKVNPLESEVASPETQWLIVEYCCRVWLNWLMGTGGTLGRRDGHQKRSPEFFWHVAGKAGSYSTSTHLARCSKGNWIEMKTCKIIVHHAWCSIFTLTPSRL